MIRKLPKVGSNATVTTRYPCSLLGADREFDEYTYADKEVLPPYAWMQEHEFRIKDDTAHGGDRVISLKHVTNLEGDLYDFGTTDTRDVPIKSGRTDEIYTVTIVKGVATKCTCKGFHFRGRCSHLKKATSNN